MLYRFYLCIALQAIRIRKKTAKYRNYSLMEGKHKFTPEKKRKAKVEQVKSRQTNYYCYCCCSSCLSFIIIISCFLAEVLHFFLLSSPLCSNTTMKRILRSDNNFIINIITTATNFFNGFTHLWHKKNDITLHYIDLESY